ncbi:hypothetical protein NDR87_04495 [Nocardia sp. CDC159]|uniref:Uncharacterized protein n=1 Tax=Nocardia pulmonis TaxID=2951408 RepID=A0A9X2IVC6_9NOCA|nr:MULTISPECIES: hypothetical protein [Nocardia]MCM6773078.1 hypothetical protein [Nocardia pulmonis]MCM6785619.1 hypothetical protein [Nocardia sp. CDC159]
MRFPRVRNSRCRLPGVLWAQPTPTSGLPRGMIAFPCEHEPTLGELTRRLPDEWSELCDAIEAEYAAWAEYT